MTEEQPPLKNEEKPAVEKPETKEAALQRELAECKDKYLRLLAEMENMRKRIQREKEEGVRFAT